MKDVEGKGGKMSKKWVKGAFEGEGQRERERGRRCCFERKNGEVRGKKRVCDVLNRIVFISPLKTLMSPLKVKQHHSTKCPKFLGRESE